MCAGTNRSAASRFRAKLRAAAHSALSAAVRAQDGWAMRSLLYIDWSAGSPPRGMDWHDQHFRIVQDRHRAVLVAHHRTDEGGGRLRSLSGRRWLSRPD